MGLVKIPNKSIQFFKDNFNEIIKSGNLAEGKWAKAVSEYVKKMCSVNYSIITASNGTGLLAVLQILKHYFNRKCVLMQSNTMYGMKTMVKSSGLEIIGYVDSDIKTLMPNIKQIKKAISNSRYPCEEIILFLSHLGGIINPDVYKISNYCKRKNIMFVEDCAHSFGAIYNDQHSGTFGDAGVFSFYATKAIPSGEGGIVITNNDEIGQKIQKYVIYDRFEQDLCVGVNIRPSEIHALFMYSVIKEYRSIISQKKTIATQYKHVCNDNGINFIDQDIDDHSGNYYKFVIITNDTTINVKYPFIKTKTSGIYDYSLNDNKFIPQHHLCLPIWYAQPDKITQKVISELNSC